jgi:hypothetical protein
LSARMDDADEQPPRRHARPHRDEIAPDTQIWCPTCQKYQLAREFPLNSSKYSGLQSECRAAVQARNTTEDARRRGREHNARRWLDPEYRRKSLEWQRKRRERLGTADLRKARARLRALVDDYKRQHPCVDCGFTDIRALDPDHRDPLSKVDNVSRLITMCASEARLLAELEKCDIVCSRCHRRRTKLQQPSRLRAGDPMPPSWERVLTHQAINDAMKLARGCVDCGWRGWARGLDWDHVRGEKRRNVSALIVNGRSWVEIEAEIDLCELRCANCHRIVTDERRAAARPGSRRTEVS